MSHECVCEWCVCECVCVSVCVCLWRGVYVCGWAGTSFAVWVYNCPNVFVFVLNNRELNREREREEECVKGNERVVCLFLLFYFVYTSGKGLV